MSFMNNNNFIKKIKSIKYELLVILFFITSRLPSLGSEIFNTDTWKWKSRIFNFGSGIFGLDFATTLQRYHPGVTLMWIGSVAVKIHSFYYKIILGYNPPDNDISTVFTLHFIQKLCIVIAIALVLASIFYALKKLFSLKYALIFLLLLSLEPFYVALTRVVHLEGLLSTFMLASFVWCYYFISKPVTLEGKSHNKVSLYLKSKKYLTLSAFFGALSLLTKTSSLYLVAFIPLMLFLNSFINSYTLSKTQGSPKDIKLSFRFISALKYSFPLWLHWLFFTILFVYLLWPALWVVPLDVFTKLQEGVVDTGVVDGHEQFFFGKLYTDPGVFFYPVVFLLKISPVLLLGLLYLFIHVVTNKILTNRFSISNTSVSKRFLLFSLLFMAFYWIEMTIPSKKLDRYLLPSIVGSILLAASGIEILLNKLKSLNFKVKYLGLFIILAIPNIVIHPDYFSYHNPLFGGLKTGINILEPKWLIGVPEINEYFEDVINNTSEDNPLYTANIELIGDERLDYEKNMPIYSKFDTTESFDRLYATDELSNKLVVAFPEKYYTQVYPHITNLGARTVIKDLTPHAKVAQYFVYPVWEDDSINEDRFLIEYIGTINIRGIPAYNVYKRLFLK